MRPPFFASVPDSLQYPRHRVGRADAKRTHCLRESDILDSETVIWPDEPRWVLRVKSPEGKVLGAGPDSEEWPKRRLPADLGLAGEVGRRHHPRRTEVVRRSRRTHIGVAPDWQGQGVPPELQWFSRPDRPEPIPLVIASGTAISTFQTAMGRLRPGGPRQPTVIFFTAVTINLNSISEDSGGESGFAGGGGGGEPALISTARCQLYQSFPTPIALEVEVPACRDVLSDHDPGGNEVVLDLLGASRTDCHPAPLRHTISPGW